MLLIVQHYMMQVSISNVYTCFPSFWKHLEEGSRFSTWYTYAKQVKVFTRQSFPRLNIHKQPSSNTRFIQDTQTVTCLQTEYAAQHHYHQQELSFAIVCVTLLMFDDYLDSNLVLCHKCISVLTPGQVNSTQTVLYTFKATCVVI